MQALRKLVYDANIYVPTFPIDSMSLAQLEHAATADYRFTSFMRSHLKSDDNINGDDRPLPGYTTRLLSFNHGSADRFGTAQYLVPGGRFLLASTDDGVLGCWDLGYSPDTAISPHPIATTRTLDLNPLNAMDVQCANGGVDLLICYCDAPAGPRYVV
jgi:hypothetical protein